MMVHLTAPAGVTVTIAAVERALIAVGLLFDSHNQIPTEVNTVKLLVKNAAGTGLEWVENA